MISRLAFYPSLAYNVAMEKFSSRQWYNRIDDTVILGALPFRSMTKQLQEEGVVGVVTLNEPYETRFFVNSKEEWASAGIEQLTLATQDLVAAPKLEQLNQGVDFIMSKRGEGSVYVHCKAGRTRSATLVACYLLQLHKWSPNQAVEFIQSKRPHIWLRKTQMDAVEMFHKQCQNQT